MAYKENYPPSLGAGAGSGILPPMLSPNKNPALIRQRDHSACRSPDTPLKVRKTRENLRQSIYTDVPPPCLHVHDPDAGQEYGICVDATVKYYQNEDVIHQGSSSPLRYTAPAQGPSKPQRQKSTSRGMLSKVKQGIANKSKSTYSIRASETGSNLIRRLSGKRKQSYEIERRTQSYGATRECSDNDLYSELGPGQRSLTASSASTMDILGDYLGDETPFSSSSIGFLDLGSGAEAGATFKNVDSVPLPAPSSPSPQPTPRPLRREARSALAIAPSMVAVRCPCVSLRVSMDCSTIDVSSKRDIWIAVEATVEETVMNLEASNQDSSVQFRISQRESIERVQPCGRSFEYGRVTSLRLCYKGTDSCVIREVVGQKRLKNVSIGQKCSLFIKVHVPELSAQGINDNASDQDSLFAELESLVGTLEVDILHIEARYRLSVLPTDNVVAIRRVCRVRRPDWSSRWSNAHDLPTQPDDPSTVYRGLAEHLASRFSPFQTIDLLQQYIGQTYSDNQDVLRAVEKEPSLAVHGLNPMLKDEQIRPSVVVTATAPTEDCEVAPHDSLFNGTDVANIFHSMSLDETALPWTSPLLSTPRLATGLAQSVMRNTLSVPSARQNVSKPPLAPLHRDQGAEDTARQLWQSIRRTSLSAQQMDALTSSEQVARLEAEDAGIRMLRRTAIANKRSVGAETLKGWKWDEEMEVESGKDRAEAPWL